ncbi:MAG: pantoate--beta-alanine ligase [Rhodospirillaceae bacterium]|jgi:pantoate--beta-alanine ligase|nr:pantoate--beta-alanine ligase [Rhodospirillaceae bacterium]MBT3925810.1 pantoate--beta-alanine ligase [Rhodospirillaceae bacterium]MBT4426250.1 pantoate--beta-alanine ligase [Rhodospirillaceae bacterium]MBT5675737.1 pantoate--beta-alanine ligase [Rhodospirillaceae bacterium]
MANIVRNVGALRAAVAEYRGSGERVALVPTMGALHGGHMALVDAARGAAERTIVSIFINPTQFAPTEDLASYPRSEAEDLRQLAEAGVDLVFMPAPDEVYGAGFATSVSVAGPGAGLESAARPHFFTGVATVVAKLLLQCLPDAAAFGEKDYQQLQVVRRLVRDLDIPCEILAIPTVREADGLACSSRNAYLTPAERAVAAGLYEILQAMAQRLATGGAVITEIEDGMRCLEQAGFDVIDYLALCDGESLVPLSELHDGARLLAAVRLGNTRLIDNVAL